MPIWIDFFGSITPAATNLEFPTLLANMPSPNVLAYPTETIVAEKVEAIAINEVSLLRQLNQAAHIRILVNGAIKVEELVCDGVLVATAAGSTASPRPD